MEPPDHCPKCHESTAYILSQTHPCGIEDICPMKQFRQREPFAPIVMTVDYTKPKRDPMKPATYVILDLDGVICRFSAQRKAFYKAQQFDKVNELGTKEPPIIPIISYAQDVFEIGAIEIFIFTSRSAKYVGETVLQLKNFGLPFRALLMRGEDDHKSSSIQLKREMFSLVSEFYPAWVCLRAVDDRQDIVDLYLSLGLNGVLFEENQLMKGALQ